MRSALALLLLLLPFPAAFAAPPATQEAAPKVRLSYLAASRGGYVFAGSDATQVSNPGVATGKTYGRSGKSYAFRPYGFEAEGIIPANDWLLLRPALRLVPMGLRLRPEAPEQPGWDGFLSLALGHLAQVEPGFKVGVDLGIRLRRWNLEDGPLPDTGHAGIVIAARLEWARWEALLETGLMGAGIKTPASLGRQRDASTLRARASYAFPNGESQRILPFVEFFHTHRDFYGASVLPGETALFIDEASLALGVSVEL